MEFSWSEEQLQFRKTVREFAERELPVQKGATGFPRDLWKRCAGFGILGLPFAPEYGGQAADIMTTVLAMEALGYGCRDNGLIFGLNAQMWSVQMPIATFGTEDQRKRYLPKLIAGEWIGGHAMSEPGSGSDAFSMRTNAVRDGNTYIINGSKTFVSLAPVADCFVVFATLGKKGNFMNISMFLVERDTPGLFLGKEIGKMGMKTCPWSEVVFEDCRVSAEQRVGREGAGAAIFSDSMEWERGCLLGGYVGAMERQLERCVQYAKERKQFGRPIGAFQSISGKLSDMKLRLETSRLLLYKLAWEKSQGRRAPMEAALVKLQVSDSWQKSCLDAIQIHGGYGYTTEYEEESEFRDSVAGSLYSGTSEIQRNIISAYLGL
jgi:hypothetical protein